MLTQRILIENDDFSLHATVDAHGWHQLAPFVYEDGRLTRVHRMKDGRIVRIQVEQTSNTSRHNFLLLETVGEVYNTDQFEIAGTVRVMLCMDWDLKPFYEYLRQMPEYDWVEPQNQGRLLRAPTVWEDLAKTLLTTNTTWRQTIGMVARLNELGEESEFGRAFPTPAQVAELSPQALTDQVKCGYRGAYLHEIARRISQGELEAEQWAVETYEPQALYEQISALPGFGPYATGSMMRLLGYHNYLSVDSVARDAYAFCHKGGEKASDGEVRAHYKQHGDWCGLVLWMDVLRRYS